MPLPCSHPSLTNSWALFLSRMEGEKGCVVPLVKGKSRQVQLGEWCLGGVGCISFISLVVDANSES